MAANTTTKSRSRPRGQSCSRACICLAADATRVTFPRLRAPTILRVGGPPLLVARVSGGDEDARRLAELLLNPLRRQYGVGYADLLRPDYVAAILAALAVNPTAARLVL